VRPTWIVLGLVVGLGAVAYVKLRERSADGGSAPLARPADAGTDEKGATPRPGGAPAPGGPDTPAPGEPTPPPAPGIAFGADAAKAEQEAAGLLAGWREKQAAGASADALALETKLTGELAETDAARRFFLDRGLADSRLGMAEGKPLAERLPAADRARRDLSRALFLRELFDASTGKPTEDRKKLVQAIATMNALVMTAAGGVPGVTVSYEVKPGESPIAIVSRQKLPYGPNLLLFWNHGGNLDPRRLRLGERLLLPQETIAVRVDLARHLLGLYLGDALVKEFEVGTGKPATPTYAGVYEVRDKFRNPDWTRPDGVVVPYGSPDNELGEAWIPITTPEHPTGYGIHGTIKPETVGTDCSNGCVRLRNAEAIEMVDWVRTSRGGGAATKVLIR